MRRALFQGGWLLGGAVVLALVGCGGPRGTADAADLVPPGASSFLRLRTSQVPRAVVLLARFPLSSSLPRGGLLRGGLLRYVPRVPPGAGPELDVATIGGGRVFYTQPVDEQAFAKQLEVAGSLHARIRGWTVFAASVTLLDAVRERRGSLTDRPWFEAASATLPSEAALREVVPGWRATGLTVQDGGAELEVHRLRPSLPLPQVGSSLAAEVPADAIAAVGVAGPQNVPRSAPKLLHELASALGGPVVGWVRAGTPLPEVTVVSRPADKRRALGATARLIGRLTKNPASGAVELGGRPMRRVANGAIDIYYGLLGGELVVTDSVAAPGRLDSASGAGGATLAAVSRLPDLTESWAYVNVSEGLPLAKLFEGLFDTQVPKALETRLASIRDLLVYASHDARVATIVTRIDTR
jgi:hypothetical protein